jgi:hypothetical protein
MYVDKKTDWISIFEELPQEHFPVWVLINENIPFQGMWTGVEWLFPKIEYDENGFVRIWGEFAPASDVVSHWMRIEERK